MELESVTLKLPRDLLSGAQRVATARDVTIGHMVRQLLAREVERQLLAQNGERQLLAQCDERQLPHGAGEEPDPRLLAALQALLAGDLAQARDWDDLAARLRPHGYDLRLSGGGLVLFKSSCGTRVCKGSRIGMSYAALVRRFGTPLPDMTQSMTHRGIMPAGRIDPRRHALLSGHIAAARSWPDLINRLAVEGMEMRAMGAGLGIYVCATGRHLCNSATVGARYQTLVKRFGAPMPGHPHDVSAHLGTEAAGPELEGEVVERG